jgi:hypothetical protein
VTLFHVRLLPQPAQNESLSANARPQLEQKRALPADDADDAADDDDVDVDVDDGRVADDVALDAGFVLSLLAAVDQKPPALTRGL